MGPDNINENIETLTSLRARAEHGVSRHQRRIERLADRLGHPRSFNAIVILALGWVGANLLMLRSGSHAVDPPPFFWLQGVTGLVALLMTTTVLIAQNRQSRKAEDRGQLELQVNLLAEQKVAKLIALLEELRRDIPTVRDRVDHMAEVMQEPVDPHAVLSALDHIREEPSSAEPYVEAHPAVPSVKGA